ncbi:prolyl 4-hydroxylase [Sphingomonas laterariae]|uniref:Prolyl 4-hydroxylase n=1 Tax=Edaphosphingomonas laterariae TaxID=861865 RepID=A0A239FJV2_9SPHN|nr:2OG-Fe(II) oxygenase [Sphingomonas laterariae]SNS56512.1 prolyl 4-hydroxylase [Sphingomonas laterariae]
MTAHTPPASIGERLSSTPGVRRFPNRKLDLFLAPDFLDTDACAAIIALIDEQRRPSTQADANGDPLYRTSETCDLDCAHPAVAALDARIAALTGLDPAHGEPMQGQRYAVGQEFKDHTDYFEPGGLDYDRYCTGCGQRTWTVMIYLNQPAAGGATRFRRIDKIIQPETGKLLAWNNLDAAGQPNGWTLHHGMKVRSGTKYVVTKWFRQHRWPHG